MAKPSKIQPPKEVASIRAELNRVLKVLHTSGQHVGNAKYGVYAFYDYDGEPIYVGQTVERLRTRIKRHLTNQRTDAVAMNVLDPFEVAEIEMWPFFSLDSLPTSDARVKRTLCAAESTVFKKVLKASKFHAVLNEKDIPKCKSVKLPKSFRARIVPADVFAVRKHSDTRIARRASTIANLARVISERFVSKGLRRTLVTQAKRLVDLSQRRLAAIQGKIPKEVPGEDTGDDD
jgi:hypothetical protein